MCLQTSERLLINTKQEADTKLNINMCTQIKTKKNPLRHLANHAGVWIERQTVAEILIHKLAKSVRV